MDIAQALSASTQQRKSVASALMDAGCQSSSSASAFQEKLRGLGVTIDEEQLAEIIVTFLAKNATT